ncbi:unnamed protein product [Camellia sinensis]
MNWMEDPLLPPPTMFKPPMKILLWNCRGTANPHFRLHYFDLIQVHKPHLVVLIETRVQGDRGKRLSENLGFSNVHIVQPAGFAGGIWFM